MYKHSKIYNASPSMYPLIVLGLTPEMEDRAKERRDIRYTHPRKAICVPALKDHKKSLTIHVHNSAMTSWPHIIVLLCYTPIRAQRPHGVAEQQFVFSSSMNSCRTTGLSLYRRYLVP
jgi:hypothetical protein